MLVMPKSPKEIFDQIETVKGKKLALYLIPLFITFLLVGLGIGNLMPKFLNKNEDTIVKTTTEKDEKESVQYKGKVVYIDPHFYPNDDVTFYLEDESGKEIILLKTNDQKLTVVEGLSVIVFGEIEETMDGEEEILIVEKIVVKN